ncbi:hypothetical protein H4J58_00150 [Colwellia sp. MB3u-70]|uniref:hypothetical protein n=1 Tax=unclassified Colwellia TaxID=196834 RepID=UPI0015F6EFD6|nr:MULTISPECIES: hypothetical protein [unclassified Colwellia]MBA6291525.1 hypothetical protein [Colwellia sp. MB3u-8]MBA6305559.1 hypothetical protein [Colwellia sp. MB3u-70]
MDSSENQFQELAAHIVSRINKILADDKDLLPLGLSLHRSGSVEAHISTTEEANDFSGQLNLLQKVLSSKVLEGNIVATSISYPDFENNVVIAFVENNENFCAKLLIPVNTESIPFLVIEDVEIEDGMIYVFPECA